MTVRPAIRRVVGAILLAGPTVLGLAAGTVLAHAELVTSTPAPGEVVATTPGELRLVFSEPIDPAYTRLDLLDPDGRTIAAGIGAPDAADPHVLVAPIEPLADGVYTVDWQSLSRADGHRTSGFFTFGVGDVAPPVPGTQGGGGDVHAGHDAVTSLLETEGRAIQLLGLLLAVGLPVIVLVVLRASPGRRLAQVAGGMLLLAAAGGILLLVVDAGGFGADPLTYAQGTRSGQLMAAGSALALGAGVVVAALGRRSPRAALLAACLAGLAGLVLIALGGHAAAYASAAPLAAILVHMVTATIWLSGVVVLASVALADAPVPRSALGAAVPRFSALALVSVGLLVLSGLYSDWIQTGTLVSVATPYGTTLLVKSLLAVAALAIGARNFVAGGDPHDRRFAPRIAIEATLAIGVVVATAVLTSGSPPAQGAPIPIAQATSSGFTGGFASTLAVAPGRPGPTRFIASVSPPPPEGDTVDVQLTRVDTGQQSRVAMQPAGEPGGFQSAGGLLPADSRWDALVIVRGPDTIERSRTRFAFALDATSISAGRATPPVDPAVVIGLVLILAAIGAGLAAATRLRLPRIDATVGRGVLAAGAGCSLVLGLVILVGGAPS